MSRTELGTICDSKTSNLWFTDTLMSTGNVPPKIVSVTPYSSPPVSLLGGLLPFTICGLSHSTGLHVPMDLGTSHPLQDPNLSHVTFLVSVAFGFFPRMNREKSGL